MQPAEAPDQFYTGMIAGAYAPLRGNPAPVEPYERFVRKYGEPALEIGCGHGEPLLDLVAAGLDVSGLDSSADMLQLCEAEATRRDLTVKLIHSRMEDLHVDQRFRSIYFAGPTFQLVINPAGAVVALQRMAEHLTPDGRVLIPLFVPTPIAADELGVWKEHTGDDGTTSAVQVSAQSYRRDEKRVDSTLNYRQTKPGRETETVERVWSLCWYEDGEFEALVKQAGLTIERQFDHGTFGRSIILTTRYVH